VKLTLPMLRWISVLLLTIVVTFEFIQTAFAAVSAEESTGIIFFAAIASLIIGLPNKRYRTLTGLMVVLGSIASVALAGLWLVGAATAAAFFVVYGLGVSLILGREDAHPLLLPVYALSHRAYSGVQNLSRRTELRLRLMRDQIGSRFPIFKPVISSIGWALTGSVRLGSCMMRTVILVISRALSLAARLISVAQKFLAHTTGLALSLAAEARKVSVLSARVLYHSRASILLWAILFASVAFSPLVVTWGSEYVKNGSFDQGFGGWTVPGTRYHREGFSEDHWTRPENCLAMTVWSQRGLSYDRVMVFQSLDAELSWGTWTVSGYMGNVDVGKECDALATSIIIVLRDNLGGTRYLKYAVLVEGELHPTPTEAVIEVGKGGLIFTRDLISSIREVWNAPYVIGWRVTGVELLVEFRNNWGDNVHLEAVFDEISLRRESDLRWLAWLASLALWLLPVTCLPTLIWAYSRVPKEKPI